MLVDLRVALSSQLLADFIESLRLSSELEGSFDCSHGSHRRSHFSLPEDAQAIKASLEEESIVILPALDSAGAGELLVELGKEVSEDFGVGLKTDVPGIVGETLPVADRVGMHRQPAVASGTGDRRCQICPN
jgi:hypothetical protein